MRSEKADKLIYRHEQKYLIDAGQEAILKLRAESVMMPDPHAGAQGSYEISSLYFDDLNDSCFFDTKDGIGDRAKYRIRIYNGDTGFIRMEKKIKHGEMTAKKSVKISKDECLGLMEGRFPESEPGFFEEMRHTGVMPKVIVSYERIPYVYPAGNVRLTFDRGIESSSAVKHFLDGAKAGRCVLPVGATVMELKWDGLLPGHITDIFQLERLGRTNFSKYCMCRQYGLI